jgi:hypothetical protein
MISYSLQFMKPTRNIKHENKTQQHRNKNPAKQKKTCLHGTPPRFLLQRRNSRGFRMGLCALGRSDAMTPQHHRTMTLQMRAGVGHAREIQRGFSLTIRFVKKQRNMRTNLRQCWGQSLMTS